jgi:hypothetical protein
VVGLYQAGFYNWVDTWNLAHYFTASVLPGLGLLALLAWLVHAFSTHGKPARKAVVRLNSLWIAALLICLGFFESLEAFATLEADAIPETGFWPILVLLGGLWWEIATSGAEWAEASEQRLKALLAFIGLMLSLSIGLIAAGSAELVMEYTLYSFLGLVYLGLPLGLYTLLQNREGYEPIPGRNLAALFGLGCLSAIGALKIDPSAGLHLLVVPVLWFVVLQIWGKALGRLENSLDGVVAGSALALGFVAFWMSPQLIPIPFLRFAYDWQTSYLSPPYRPLLQTGHLWLTLLALAAGLSLGWVFATRRPWIIRLALLAACLLIFAGLLPLLPGMAAP